MKKASKTTSTGKSKALEATPSNKSGSGNSDELEEEKREKTLSKTLEKVSIKKKKKEIVVDVGEDTGS